MAACVGLAALLHAPRDAQTRSLAMPDPIVAEVAPLCGIDVMRDHAKSMLGHVDGEVPPHYALSDDRDIRACYHCATFT